MKIFRLLKQSGQHWINDDAALYGAAIGYYTIFSIGPLITIIIWVMGLFLGEKAMADEVFNLLASVMNENVAKVVQGMAINALQTRKEGLWITLIGFFITLFSAMRIVILMKESLDKMWKIHKKESETKLIKKYIIGLAGVFGIGIILFVTGVMNALILMFGNNLFHMLPFTKTIILVVNNLIVFICVTAFIAATFKYLPNLQIRWKAVLPGSFLTTSLFFIGKIFFSLYMSTQVFGSTYGAASSLVVFIMWVYFSCQVVFFGAEFTQIYAQEHHMIIKTLKR